MILIHVLGDLRDYTEEVNVGVVDCEINEDCSRTAVQPKIILYKSNIPVSLKSQNEITVILKRGEYTSIPLEIG